MPFKLLQKSISKLICLGILVCSLVSCAKENIPEAPVPPIIHSDITFDRNHTHFSTDSSEMNSPVDSNQAKLIVGKIDITYTYPSVMWGDVGFIDPITRSQHWSWDDYYQSWLSNSVETRYFKTTLSQQNFNDAMLDEKKINDFFFNDSFVLANHPVFPTGTCIGGIQNMSQPGILYTGEIYGFQNVASGKRGLINMKYVYSWSPIPDGSNLYPILIDIIKEH